MASTATPQPITFIVTSGGGSHPALGLAGIWTLLAIVLVAYLVVRWAVALG